MPSSNHRNLCTIILNTGLALVLLLGCSPDPRPEAFRGLKGMKVQADSIMTSNQVDAMLDQAEAGHLDALFVNVLANGYAYWEGQLLDKHPGLAEDFDPLDYVIDKAHERGIAVHAWVLAGPVSFKGRPAPILTEHPDWAMMGADGRQTNWLNYTHPDVRRFISALVQEIVQTYEVDGIHFDYTRYPGSQWGYDPYSAEAFLKESGTDLDLLRYRELPAYGTFSGKPLLWVGSAQVLAEFDNGQPAVLLNQHGEGQSIVLNWNATERQVAVSGEILDRSIRYLADGHDEVYVLRSEATISIHGEEVFQQALAWIEDLGWSPQEIAEEDLGRIAPDSVLILPQVYVISTQVGSDLAAHVRRGGGAIFIEGPAPSIWNKHVRAVTGMNLRGKYFQRTGLLLSTGEHDIIPHGDRVYSLEEYEALDAQWYAFRRAGISALLQNVYQRVKKESPDVLISISISDNQEALAQRHLLDWQSWLDGGYVDYIVVRTYVEGDEALAPRIADWERAIESSGRIMLALKVYSGRGRGSTPKSPRRVLREIAAAQATGTPGLVLFDIEHASDAVLDALASGPFLAPDSTSD